jgi:hypothetical protein
LGGLTFGHVSRDVRALIRDPANADAVFQVASQVGNLSLSCAIIRRLMWGLMQGRHTLSFVDVRLKAYNNAHPLYCHRVSYDARQQGGGSMYWYRYAEDGFLVPGAHDNVHA